MSFFENTRKPVGFGGKIMVAMMNFGLDSLLVQRVDCQIPDVVIVLDVIDHVEPLRVATHSMARSSCLERMCTITMVGTMSTEYEAYSTIWEQTI